MLVLTASCGCSMRTEGLEQGVWSITHTPNCSAHLTSVGIPNQLPDIARAKMSPHTKISFLKSGFRGVGYGMLAVAMPALFWPMVVLVLSELIGIFEECVV